MRSCTALRATPALALALTTLALGFPDRARAQIPIDAGSVATFTPADAVCIKSLNVRNSGENHEVRQGCHGKRITVLVGSGLSPATDIVDITATTRFVLQIRIPRVLDSAEPSFVPIHITVPVLWRGFLWNDNLVPNTETNITGNQGAHVNVNTVFEVFEGMPGSPGMRLERLKAVVVQGASHAGASGCLSVPKTKVQAAKMLTRCAASLWVREEGDGIASLSTLVETGKTYDIELALSADLYTVNAGPGGGRTVPTPTPGGHPRVNFEKNPISERQAGLYWNGPMVVRVGTDYEEGLMEVRGEIARLEQLIEDLRELFEGHTHDYRTGRGVGHNRRVVETSPPNE